MNKKYYSLNKSDNEANIVIYGNISSWSWNERNTSAYNLSKQLEDLDVEFINIYINSYGGEVAEGLAIYNTLKRHKAKVRTYCDGFACSIASVIFMAGDERIMSNASMLMIHNAWTYTKGNANELRKEADDLEKMTQASINAYMQEVNITEEELKQLLDNETWLTPQEAFQKGFATTITNEKKNETANQDVRDYLISMILERQSQESENKVNELHQKLIKEDEKELNLQTIRSSFFSAINKIVGGNDNGIINKQ